ncbi:MAG: ABC transporter permease [Synergistales bacterium]|nr:ABC transporter permease [Synergistales bacterium]
MRWRRTAAVARKETLHILRDPRSLAMAVAIPVLLILLFGYALTLDVDNVPLALLDRDHSSAGRELTAAFAGSRYFTLHTVAAGRRELQRALDTGGALVALTIPPGFGADLSAGRTPAVQIVIEGSDANTAGIARGYVRAVTERYSRRILVEQAARRGREPLQPPLELRQRVWYNPEMDSTNYIVPGLIAVIMMVIAALLTSLTIAREWEQGTMEQLIATPVTAVELITGKLLPYFAVGMLDVLVAVLMGEFLYGVPFRGNVVLLFGMAAIFLAGSLSMGILISVVTRSQLLASQVAIIVTFLPSFLLSGFMFAITSMPQPIRIATHLIPARYFVTLLRGIYLKGVGLAVLWPEALLLALFSLVMVALANLAFTKRLV